jgi:hypothetical protein
MKYISLSAITTALLLTTAPAQSQVITADSPAFDKDYSIDLSALRFGSFEKTRKVPITTKSQCGCFTTTTLVNQKYHDTPYTAYSARVNARLSNAVFSVGTVTTGYYFETAIKTGAVVTGLGLDLKDGNITKRGSVAVSPVKNVAVYSAYNLSSFNFGVQWQAGKDLSLSVNYRPNLATYNFAVTANFGPAAPTPPVVVPPAATPPVATLKVIPVATPAAIPVTTPRAIPVPPAPIIYIRGRG